MPAAKASQGYADVPVIGRGNKDGVDVFFVQQFAVIEMRAREIVRALANLVAARLVDVAAGDQLKSSTGIGGVEIAAHAASAANGAETYGIARARGSGGGQRAQAAGNEEASAVRSSY